MLMLFENVILKKIELGELDTFHEQLEYDNYNIVFSWNYDFSEEKKNVKTSIEAPSFRDFIKNEENPFKITSFFSSIIEIAKDRLVVIHVDSWSLMEFIYSYSYLIFKRPYHEKPINYLMSHFKEDTTTEEIEGESSDIIVGKPDPDHCKLLAISITEEDRKQFMLKNHQFIPNDLLELKLPMHTF